MQPDDQKLAAQESGTLRTSTRAAKLAELPQAAFTAETTSKPTA